MSFDKRVYTFLGSALLRASWNVARVPSSKSVVRRRFSCSVSPCPSSAAFLIVYQLSQNNSGILTVWPLLFCFSIDKQSVEWCLHSIFRHNREWLRAMNTACTELITLLYFSSNNKIMLFFNSKCIKKANRYIKWWVSMWSITVRLSLTNAEMPFANVWIISHSLGRHRNIVGWYSHDRRAAFPSWYFEPTASNSTAQDIVGWTKNVSRARGCAP